MTDVADSRVISDHPRVPIGRGPVMASGGGILLGIGLAIAAFFAYAEDGILMQAGGMVVPLLFVFAGAWGLAAQRRDAKALQHVTLHEAGVVERSSAGDRAWRWHEVASVVVKAHGPDYSEIPGMVVTTLYGPDGATIEVRSQRLQGWSLETIGTVRRCTLAAHRDRYRAALDAGTRMEIGDTVMDRQRVVQGNTSVDVADIAQVRELPLDLELVAHDGRVAKIEGNGRPNVHLLADLIRYAAG